MLTTEPDWTRPLAPSDQFYVKPKQNKTKFGRLFHPACGGAGCLVGGTSHLSRISRDLSELCLPRLAFVRSSGSRRTGKRGLSWRQQQWREGNRQNGEGQGPGLSGKRPKSGPRALPNDLAEQESWPRSSALHTCR